MGKIKNIICPKCGAGTLEILTERERIALTKKQNLKSLPNRVMGCDECDYWIAEDLL